MATGTNNNRLWSYMPIHPIYAHTSQRRNTQFLTRINFVGVAQHRTVGFKNRVVLVGVAIVFFGNGRQGVAFDHVVILRVCALCTAFDLEFVFHFLHCRHVASGQGHFFERFAAGRIARNGHGAGFAVKRHAEIAHAQVLQLDVMLDRVSRLGVELIQRSLIIAGRSLLDLFAAEQLFSGVLDKTERSGSAAARQRHPLQPVVSWFSPFATEEIQEIHLPEVLPASRHSHALLRVCRLASKRTRLERQDDEESTKDNGVRGD